MTLIEAMAIAAGVPADRVRAVIDAGAAIDPALAEAFRAELAGATSAENLDRLNSILPAEIDNIRKGILDGRDLASGDI